MLSRGLGVGPVRGMMESLVVLPTVDQEGLGPEVKRGQLVQGWAAPRCPTRSGWSLAFFLKVMGRQRILDCPECHQYHWLVVLQRNQGKCCWEAEASLGFWAGPRTSGGGGCSPAPSASVRLEGALTRKG